VGKRLFPTVALQDDQNWEKCKRKRERYRKVYTTNLKFVFPPLLSAFPFLETNSLPWREGTATAYHRTDFTTARSLLTM
jgi:hypothetical protein